MSIGKKLKILNVILIFVVLILIGTILLTTKNQIDLNSSYDNKYESYQSAVELRNSSDALTRLARTYVVTGEKKYEDEYWNILAVRNGEKQRADGRKISLDQIMKNLGFTSQEFEKLKEAGNNSNNLVTTETIAMNAVKGLFADGSGGYTKKGEPDFDMARRIMFDSKYHADKKIITDPIDQFEKMLHERTFKSAEAYKKLGNIYLIVIACLAILLALLIFLTNQSVKKVLENIVKELNKSILSSNTVASRIGESTESMASATNQQAAAAQETSATLDEIAAMVERNLENARSSNTKAENSFAVAQDGQNAVEDMRLSIKEVQESNALIMQDVLESNREIENIVNVIRGISEKTKVINDIVFQTKLLSFNASVEAARAGEHGKGFAVVAEEVGALSNMSGTAANDISDMLTKSMVDVEKIIAKTKANIERLDQNSNEKFAQSIQVSQRCAKALEEVVENVNEVKTLMEQITTASSEQVEGVKNINIAMTEIESGTQLTSRAAKEVDFGTQELVGEFKKVEDLVQELAKEVLGKTIH